MVKKKYLWRHPAGRIYVRLKGRLYRIHAQEGTEDFDREYWEILTGKRMQAKTSWNALIEDYRTSDRWLGLKPRTRQDYDKVMLYLREKIGPRDVKSLTRSDVIAAQKANSHRTRFANYIPQMLVILCEHAIDLGWIANNPAKGVRALKTPQHRKKEHLPWPDWAVDKFRAEASDLPRLIFEIGVGSVQRPGDWVGFRWGDYDGDSLTLRQNKTDKPLVLPCTAELKSALDTAKAALGVIPIAGKPILSKLDGNPMGYRYMSQVMLRERRRLGLEAYDLHALRYRGVQELAWQGCTDDEIAAYSGHATKAMIEKYAGEARQVMRARQAREKRK
ncbi:site-specific recombinase XerC [Rhodovulum bhavnagarense]|uniref:Site-specific recombinase XerC n=1 Tax=Rhodovulum bhavnagarense TaxID=992286 RepID=A0A4R2RF37_9RHOB|nr:tyrosine-type recombinase/integrase [Rhodovulum bhavnagarense]TCP62172.1 site-specific recombinase XerC [Rhodovulum bhavnagarense]